MDTSEGYRRHRQSRLRRAGPLAATLIGITLLVAACGGSSSSGGQASLDASFRQGNAYSQCMRSHGIAKFPNPTKVGGNGVELVVPGPMTDLPQYNSANKTCEKQTGYGHVSAADTQALMDKAKKFAACMRSHGIAKFPDPVMDGDYVKVAQPNIPQGPRYDAAHTACQSLIPAA